MTVRCLIFYVGGVNGDTASLLLRSLIDRGIIGKGGPTRVSKDFGDGRCQCCLSVINMTYRTRSVSVLGIREARCPHQ